MRPVPLRSSTAPLATTSPSHVATPSKYTTPSPAIATAINTATRSLHTELNRLIIGRLPLALPPNAETTLLYGIGITTFAKVYEAFEEAWDAAVADGTINKTLAGALKEMMMPAIRRREVLKRDIRHVKRLLSRHPAEMDLFEQTMAQSTSKTEEYTQLIGPAIMARPLVIIAYAWVMYMAIFSGGRWIRMVLREAGPGFWGHDDKDEVRGFEFLTFEGEHDGEDIKAMFKEQLGVVEGLLSETQKHDVVEEARVIFQASVNMVYELDEVIAGIAATSERHGHAIAAETGKKPEMRAKVVREVLKVEKLAKSAMSAPLQLLIAMALCLLALTILDSSKRVMFLGNVFPRSYTPHEGGR
jgi:heme oxygenase